MSDAARAAYAAALAMFARRELSEAQVRERLARKEHPPEAIEDAILRLRAAGVVDDRRVALAAARTEVAVRSRGRARVMLRLQAIGIPHDVAREAADEVMAGIDEAGLLDRAVARRLRGSAIRDASHFRRLFQQLIRQGFSPAAVSKALRARGRHESAPDDETT